MSVSQRLRAFLRKYKFLLPLWYFKEEAGRPGNRAMRTQELTVPRLPATRDPLKAIHRRGTNKEGKCRREAATLLFLNCQLECLKLRGSNYHIRSKLIILFWAKVLNLVFKAPDQNIQKDCFLTLWGPKPSCGAVWFLFSWLQFLKPVFWIVLFICLFLGEKIKGKKKQRLRN